MHLIRRLFQGKSLVLASSVAGLLVLSIAGCTQKPKEPIQIGFLGGLTGRTADLGTDGRNGVQLAIEQVNAAGGINGRKLNLIIKDDESNADRGKIAVNELIAAKVSAIFGPMTSNVAVATAQAASEANILMLAGTVTTTALSGKDDHFFRVIGSTTKHAATMADFLVHKRKVSTASLLVNMGNKAYTESWANDFEQAFSKLGGRIASRIEYPGGDNIRYEDLVKKLTEKKPDAVILITNAVDAAQLANQLVRLGSKAVLTTTEWAGTGKLTDLGGSNVEGVVVPQYVDRFSTDPAYLSFREAYTARFQQVPGFPAVMGFGAAQVVFRGLREQQANESLKQTLLRLRKFDVLQGSIEFDDFGDVNVATHLTEIRNGQYEIAK